MVFPFSWEIPQTWYILIIEDIKKKQKNRSILVLCLPVQHLFLPRWRWYEDLYGKIFILQKFVLSGGPLAGRACTGIWGFIEEAMVTR